METECLCGCGQSFTWDPEKQPGSPRKYVNRIHKTRGHRRADSEAKWQLIAHTKIARGGVCEICMTPYGLVWHHLRDKLFLISDPRRHTLIELQAELEKCQLLCTSCHSRTHHSRKGGQPYFHQETEKILESGIVGMRKDIVAMLTVSQTAEIFGVTTQTIRTWEGQGLLKATRTLGGHRRFSDDDIKEAIVGRRYQQSIVDDDDIVDNKDYNIVGKELS